MNTKSRTVTSVRPNKTSVRPNKLFTKSTSWLLSCLPLLPHTTLTHSHYLFLYRPLRLPIYIYKNPMTHECCHFMLITEIQTVPHESKNDANSTLDVVTAAKWTTMTLAPFCTPTFIYIHNKIFFGKSLNYNQVLFFKIWLIFSS